MNANEPASVMISEYWTIVVRRKWLVISTFLTCLLIAGLLSLVLPKSYRSNTLILIENQKIPDDYVKGIGGGSVEERLTMIQQQVMSRTLLSQIIGELRVYESQVENEGIESAIEGMRKVIKVETVGTVGPRGKSVEAVTISFSHENPIIAMKVTQKLASLFIEENLKVREQLVTGVSTFLEAELHDAKKRLEAQEQAISQFKTKHIGLLPEQLESNLRALDRLQSDLNSTDELLHKQADRLSLVEKSIKEYETIGTTEDGVGTTRSAHTKGDPLILRLRELERQLTTLKAEYKENYPDIGQIKQEIASIKSQLSTKYGDPSDDRDADIAKTYDPYLRDLLKHRNELSLEITSTRDRRHRLAEHIKEFERRVEQTPSREQDLMILMRDYENMQKNYQALLDKRLNAHVAENLEKRQKGEQFRILDPANVPEKLDKPNRPLILILGLLSGCGFGLGLAIGLDRLNPTFKRREEIEVLPGIRVLAAIPKFFTGYGQLSAASMRPLIAGHIREEPSSKNRRVDSGAENGPSVPHFNLISKWQPLSIAAEQYRMAATRMVLATEGLGSKVIQVTSALKGEGKTTTVVNLGYTLARDLGRKILLLECDFRCPELHKYVQATAQSDLHDFLNGRALLENCISTIDEVPCYVLAINGIRNEPNELTRIEELKIILPKLRTAFDYIIVNTPPILPSASIGILASLADIHIMVIRAGMTPKHIVQRAFTMLGLTGEAHVILNAVEAQSMPSYMYGYPVPQGGGQLMESARNTL
jgi:polysaccharide biosynthesis transport protein